MAKASSAEHHRIGLEYLPKEFPVIFHDWLGLSVAHIRKCFQPMGLNGSSLLILVGFVPSLRNHHRLRSLGHFCTSKPPVSAPFTSDRPSTELEGTASRI